MSVDTIGDFLTIIRNGLRASKPLVLAPYSRLKEQIADILKAEGFIRDYKVEEVDGHKQLKVLLRYTAGESAIHAIKRISTPGRRVYAGHKTIKPVIGGLGISIVTTSRGVMTDRQAREQALGGEVICTIW